MKVINNDDRKNDGYFVFLQRRVYAPPITQAPIATNMFAIQEAGKKT